MIASRARYAAGARRGLVRGRGRRRGLPRARLARRRSRALPGDRARRCGCARARSCARTRSCCSASPSADELRLFDLLIGVSGVGPKLALAALSGLKPAALARAIRDENLARARRGARHRPQDGRAAGGGAARQARVPARVAAAPAARARARACCRAASASTTPSPRWSRWAARTAQAQDAVRRAAEEPGEATHRGPREARARPASAARRWCRGEPDRAGPERRRASARRRASGARIADPAPFPEDVREEKRLRPLVARRVRGPVAGARAARASSSRPRGGAARRSTTCCSTVRRAWARRRSPASSRTSSASRSRTPPGP